MPDPFYKRAGFDSYADYRAEFARRKPSSEPVAREPIAFDDRIRRSLSPRRPTEKTASDLVWLLEQLEQRYQWRTARYGAIKLTPREAYALRLEQEIIAAHRREYRLIERAADAHTDQIRAARPGRSVVYYASVWAAYIEGENQRIATNIHHDMAKRMRITDRRVRQLLGSAENVIRYFVLRYPDAPVWVETRRGWALNVPVSDFAVTPSEKAVS